MAATVRLLVALLVCASPVAAQDLDLVLAGGRVMDPESGLDAVRHVGIAGLAIEPVVGELRCERIHGNSLLSAGAFVTYI